MALVELVIETEGDGVFVDTIRSLQLHRVEEIGACAQHNCAGRAKRREQSGDCMVDSRSILTVQRVACTICARANPARASRTLIPDQVPESKSLSGCAPGWQPAQPQRRLRRRLLRHL